MSRINLRPLAKLAAGVAVLAALALAVHHVQLRRTAGRLRSRAESAAVAGRPGEALDAWARYLALRPGDAAALLRHARLLDQTAATPAARARAAAAYERVVRTRPGWADARRRLAELEAGRGRYDKVRFHLNILLRLTPGDAGLEELAGRCQEAAGDLEGAARWYRRAIGHDPARRGAALGLATLGRGPLRDPGEADRAVDGLVAADPSAFDVWLARGRYRRTHGLPGAEADLARARALAHDDPGVLLETARAARGRGAVAEARAELERAEARHPHDPRFYQEHADLELKDGRADRAVAVLERGLAAAPGEPGLRWALGHVLAERGETAALALQVARLRSDPAGYPPAALDYLGAWLAYHGGRWSEAARALERAGPALAAWPEIRARADELLARCYGRLGDPARRADAARRALALDPRRGAARAELAEALAAQGRLDQAAAEYRGLLPAAPAARAPLARLLIRRNAARPPSGREWAEVDRLLADLARDPGDPGEAAWARRARAVRLAATGDPARAREALALLGDGRGDDPDDRRARARILAALGGLGRRREAVALLEGLGAPGAGADDAGGAGDDRVLLAGLYEAVGDWDRARAQIAAAAGSEGLDTAGRVGLAEALLRHGEAAVAAPLVDRVARDEPDALRTAVLRARLLAARGDAPAAAALLADRARAHPGEALPIAASLERLGQAGAAGSLYRAAAAPPGRPEAALALAGFLARHGGPAEALELCVRAWANCRPEDVARATAAALGAARADAGSAAAGRAVGRLEAAAADDGATPAVLASLASVREIQGRFDDAERLYRLALRRDPADAVALNNLAVLLALRGGDRREALELADRALARAGPVPELLDTRGIARLAAGDAAGAVEDLTEAVALAPTGAAYFHLAQAHLLARDRPRAAAAFRRAAALGLAGGALHPLERAGYLQVVADLGRH